MFDATETDFETGQLDAHRIAILAIAMQMPDKEKLLRQFQELSQSLEAQLLARPVSDLRLSGLASERDAISSQLRIMIA